MDTDFKSFSHVFMSLQGGHANESASEQLHKCIKEVMDACHDRGGKHKATLTITVEVTMDQKDKIIEIVPVMDTKLPKEPKPRPDCFWPTQDGYLTTKNPRQLDFTDEVARQRQEKIIEQSGVVHADAS